QLDATPTIELPVAALTEFDRRPAVWVVDAASLTVSPRTVEVLRHNPATVAIASGLEPGEIVVTAGTQALHPGQKPGLLESARCLDQISGKGRCGIALLSCIACSCC